MYSIVLFYEYVQLLRYNTPMKQLRGVEVIRFNKVVKRELKGKKDIVLVLFSVDYQANLGMIFRLADAIGVTKLYLTGGMRELGGNIFNKVSRHKEAYVPWERAEDIAPVLNTLKKDGYTIVGVEITDTSERFDAYQWPDKVALVLGNEGHGIPNKILDLCDSAVYVPMLGEGGSLNVAVAASIVAYKVLLS